MGTAHLAMAVRQHLWTFVMRSVVIVTGRYDLAAFNHDGTKGEAHRTLRCRLGTLGKVKLGLIHDCMTVEGEQ